MDGVEDDDGNVRLGRNIRTLREALGMTQAELAKLMTDEYGVPGIYPQTIAKIESGSRVLKFHEGLALAFSLNVAPIDLYQMTPTDVQDASLAHAKRQFQGVFNETVSAVANLTSARDGIWSILMRAREKGASQGMLNDMGQALVELSVESAVAQAKAADRNPDAADDLLYGDDFADQGDDGVDR